VRASDKCRSGQLGAVLYDAINDKMYQLHRGVDVPINGPYRRGDSFAQGPGTLLMGKDLRLLCSGGGSWYPGSGNTRRHNDVEIKQSSPKSPVPALLLDIRATR